MNWKVILLQKFISEKKILICMPKGWVYRHDYKYPEYIPFQFFSIQKSGQFQHINL